MRNLKKVLSLALAMVMLLGMMVVGAGATSFKDDSSIPENRAVAVAVANALEVLLGDENGNFNPDNTLTRAEAAVVLTKLDLGADAAKALTATNAATFDDVGTGYGWAKAYIDYCAGNGYMVGVGGNRFAPGRTLTSVEFATMVSRVLGYKDENEYGKDGWTAVKAAALARKAGLGADVVVANADMTRADMAQMVFNALTAPMVEYTGLNGSIGDATFNSPATTRKHANDTGRGDTDYKGDLIQPNITPIRLCEERFPYLKLSTTAEDSFGHTASVWKNRNVEIKGSETTVEADVTITGKVLKTLPDWAKIKGLRTNTKSELFINGDTSTALPADMDKFASNLTDNGRLVEIYLNEADLTLIDKVVITDTALAEVTKVVDSNESISVKLAKSDVTTSSVVLNTKEGYGEFKKGDLVLVQGYGSAVLNKDTTIDNVNAPTVVEGFATVKRYNDTNKATYIRVENEDRYDAHGVMTGYAVDDFDLNTEFDSTLYLDQYGYIMKAIEGKDPKAVSDKLIAVSEVYQTLTDGKIVTMIKGVISNGETVTWATNGNYNTYRGYENQIMLWSKDGSRYALTPITSSKTSISSTDKENNNRQLYTLYNSSSTVHFKSNDVFGQLQDGTSRVMYSDTVRFIFVDPATSNSEGVVVVNGRQSYDFAAVKNSILAQALNADGEITAVFVSAKSGVANISDIIFVSSRYKEWDEVITRDDGTRVQYYGYTAYTSTGEAIDHFLGVDPDMDQGTGYFYVADKNADGAYKATRRAMLDTHTMVSGDLRKANGTAGDAFTLKATDNKIHEFVGRSNTVVKDLTTATAKLYIESISELNAAKNNGYDLTIAVIYNDTDTNALVGDGKVKEAKTVFVTKAVKSATTDPTTPSGKPSDNTPTGSTEVGGGNTLTATRLTSLLASGDVVVTSSWTADGSVTVPAGRTLTFKNNATFDTTKKLIIDAKGTVLVDGELKIANDVPANATVYANSIEVDADATSNQVEFAGTVTAKGALTIKAGKTLNVTGTVTVGSVTGNSTGKIIVLSTESLHVSGNVSAVTIQAGDSSDTTGASNGLVEIKGTLAAGAKFDDQNVTTETVTAPVQKIAEVKGEVTMAAASKLSTETFEPSKVNLAGGAEITLEQGTTNSNIGFTNEAGVPVKTTGSTTIVVKDETNIPDTASGNPTVPTETAGTKDDSSNDNAGNSDVPAATAPFGVEAFIVYDEASFNAAKAAGVAFGPKVGGGQVTQWSDIEGNKTLPWLMVKVTTNEEGFAATIKCDIKKGSDAVTATEDSWTTTTTTAKGKSATFHWELGKANEGQNKIEGVTAGTYTVSLNWTVGETLYRTPVVKTDVVVNADAAALITTNNSAE